VGIYDRDYYRQEQPGFVVGRPRSAVVALILINAAVWLADALFAGDNHWIHQHLALRVGTLVQPWMWWQFVTYGFVHDYTGIGHVLFNMLALFFLGRAVEEHYGRAEFTRLYLVLLVVGGVAWAAINFFHRDASDWPLVGASGAVTGVVILFALNFPRQTILLMFVFPMPAWVLGMLIVLGDVWGAIQRPDAHVAFTVHLAGAAFAFLYFQQRWNFGTLLQGRLAWPWFRSRGRLRVHRPWQDREVSDAELREKEVDRILEKIHREGESSLTRKERRILESASREYQERRRGN
jgi:membrane associated rhomboid family serine protease